MTNAKPAAPGLRAFSSGPCAKIPGWTPSLLNVEVLGRSHRSKLGKARLKHAIDLTREVLEVPDDHLIGIVPGIRHRRRRDGDVVDAGRAAGRLLAWESFGEGWVTDVVKQLKLKDARMLNAPYGELPDLRKVDSSTTWSSPGTARPRACACRTRDWISADRAGPDHLRCDVAAFAQALDLAKLDVVTFSWQKVLGGEGAHGVLILVAPRGRAAGELHAALAAAEDLPPDQGRQADRRHLRGRDDQHAVDALRRGLYRRARMGARRSAASRA